MAYTLDAMISAFQKAAAACRDSSPDGLRLHSTISAVGLEGEDEIECFYIAVNQNYIKTYTNTEGQQSFSLENEGKIELARLLEKRESLRRETMFLQHAQEQAKISLRTFYVAVFALIGSAMYLVVAILVAVGTLCYPVRVELLNPAPVNLWEHRQCEIPHEKQHGDCPQQSDKH